ncbi:MAG: acyl-CoA thioester hydrolase [Yoonia sp.]|jgi:acyl-CoA thioester hydrolase
MTRPTPNTRDDYVVFQTITTRWFDNDVYGHMNNAVHYQLFDTAVNGHLMSAGVLDLKSSLTVFLVVQTSCDYFGELAFPDLITAGVRVAHLGKSSVTYDIGLFRNDAGEAAAQGQFVHVNVDRDSRQAVPIGDATRRVLTAMRLGG